MGTTQTHGLPYPENTDLVTNGAAAMQQLAEAVDDKLPLTEGVPVGSITMYGGNGGDNVPVGWWRCNGQELSRSQFPDLFAVVGTTFGAGDGSTTFNLPNITERFPVGRGGDYAPGETGGEVEVTLTEAQLPPHDHSEVGLVGDSGGFNQLQSGTTAGLQTGSSGMAGSGQPHENRPPFIALTFIIKAVA